MDALPSADLGAALSDVPDPRWVRCAPLWAVVWPIGRLDVPAEGIFNWLDRFRDGAPLWCRPLAASGSIP